MSHPSLPGAVSGHSGGAGTSLLVYIAITIKKDLAVFTESFHQWGYNCRNSYTIRMNGNSVTDLIPSEAITKPSRGRTPWSGPPTEVCTHGPIWPDHPAQAASCAAHACRCQASKASLDLCARTARRLSLRVLLPPGMQPRSPALHCTNPWCLAVVCMIGRLTHVHIGHAPGSSLSARAIAGE